MSSVLDGIPALLPTNVGPAFAGAYGQARQQGLQQQQVNQQGQQLNFQQAQEVSAIVSRAAQLADTPEKWATTMGVLQKNFPNADLTPFQDFNSRSTVLAQLKDPYKDATLSLEQQRLALETANANRPSFGAIGTNDLGVPQYGWVDRAHQTVTPSSPTTASTGQGAATAGPLYDRLPDGQKAIVDAIIQGREPLPSGTALKSPYWIGLIQAANERSQQLGGSGFDATMWTARNSTNKNFTSGTIGATINSGNTAIGHVDQLSQLVDKLPDVQVPFVGGLPFVGGAARAATQAAVRGTPDGQALSQWDVVRKAVSDEVTKFWRGSGGAESDVQAALGNLGTAKSKPELHAAINALVDLMGSKISALQNQWHNGMGPEVPDFPVLTPGSSAKIDAIRQRANPGAPAAPAGPAAPQPGAPAASAGSIFDWSPETGLRPAR